MIDAPPILVFDLDGTLADTAPDLVGTLNVLMRREGLKRVPVGAARAMVGAGARALIERGFAHNDAPLAPERVAPLVAEFLAYYEDHIADDTRLFPGAEDALARLAGTGFRFAVCTNKPERLARLLLTRLGVAGRFAAICGCESFPMHKPDGRALLLAIHAARGRPERAVMVGDSKIDIDSARNAGVPVAAVDFGYTDTPVAELGPDRIISHFDELWEAATALLGQVAGKGAQPRT